MNEPRPFASLSPSLLARKGAARPAMRPQIQPLHQFHEATARQIEDDLGWNDMGHDLAGHDGAEVEAAPVVSAPIVSAEVVSIAPEPAPVPAMAPVPEVVRQQAEVAARVAVAQPAPVAALAEARVRRSALADGRRAAFTLRLDAERHLKLRLASTIANRSAQQLVTDALDQFFASLPDVDSLAAQVRKRR
jgi:hypothetical protein